MTPAPGRRHHLLSEMTLETSPSSSGDTRWVFSHLMFSSGEVLTRA